MTFRCQSCPGLRSMDRDGVPMCACHEGNARRAEHDEQVLASMWRPIETAPKDGAIVDLWMAGDEGGARYADAYWGRPEHTCGEAGRYCDCCPTYDGWVDSTFNHYITGEEGGLDEPSHWRPLPPPPVPANDEGRWMVAHTFTDEPLFDLVGFSRRVRIKMAELNVSYRDAAPMLGISHATLHRTATGKGIPDVETYLRLCRWMEA